MPVTATSTMAIAVEAARNCIANSATFQTLTSTAGDPEQAKNHIFIYECLDPAGARPYALLILDPDSNYLPISPGCREIAMLSNNAVFFLLSVDADQNADAEKLGDAYLKNLNEFGGILDDMSGKFSDPDLDPYGFTNIEILLPPDRSDENERANEDYFAAVAIFQRQEG